MRGDDYFKLIVITFFLTGLWFPLVGIPISSFLLVMLFKKYFIDPTALMISQYLLIILFLIFYLLFWNDPDIPKDLSYYKGNEIMMMVELFAVLSAVFWIPAFINKPTQLVQILYSFSLGMFFKSLLYTLYTLIMAPALLGFRKILDPFTMAESNSPAISLMAVYAVLIAIYRTFLGSKSKWYLVFNIFVISGGLFIAVLLQARTFFIIITVFTSLLILSSVIVKKSLKIFLFLPLIVLFLVFLSNYLRESNVYYQETFDNTFLRFQEEGGESSRYQLWQSALSIIEDKPFGGGSTDKGIEPTYWFHNLWLDIGRTSGVIPIVILLLFQFRVIKLQIKNLFVAKKIDYYFLFIFYIALLIGQFVEVSLEGNLVLFVYFIFYHSIVLNYQFFGKRRNYVY